MYGRLCHAFVTFMILANHYADGTDLTIEQAINESKTVINAQISKENDDILQKYFFTTTKSMSIWNAAKSARDTITDDILEKSAAKRLVEGINQIKTAYTDCFENTDLEKKVECWHKLACAIKDLNKYIQWDESWEVEVNYGIYYNAFALMVYHITVIAANDYKKAHGEDLGKAIAAHLKESNGNDTEGSGNEGDQCFLELLKDMNSLLDDIDLSARTWRLVQVTPVQICDVVDIFWQEFAEDCKPAWIKMKEIAADPPDMKDTGKMTKNEKIVDKFGTKLRPGVKKYRFTIKDKVTERNIFERDLEVDTSESDLQRALKTFLDEVMEEKVKAERNVKKKLDKYSELYYESIGNLGDHIVKVIT